MCTIEAGLMAASAAVGFIAQQQEADAHNTASMANAQRANLAATAKYDEEQKRYVHDSKANLLEGYKAAMKGREAIGTSRASATSSGIDLGSLSYQDLEAAQRQASSLNAWAVQEKNYDLRESYVSRTKAYEAEAEGRAAAMPQKDGPNPLGLAINLASAGARGYGANPKMDSAKLFNFSIR